jgi:hypothetical protein
MVTEIEPFPIFFPIADKCLRRITASPLLSTGDDADDGDEGDDEEDELTEEEHKFEPDDEFDEEDFDDDFDEDFEEDFDEQELPDDVRVSEVDDEDDVDLGEEDEDN